MEGVCRGCGATPSGAGMNALVASKRCRWFRAARWCLMPSQIDMGGERAREDGGLLTVVVEERVVLIHATRFVSEFKHQFGFSQLRAQHFLGSIFNTFKPPRLLPSFSSSSSSSFTALHSLATLHQNPSVLQVLALLSRPYTVTKMRHISVSVSLYMNL